MLGGALSPISVLLSHKRFHVQIEQDEAQTNDRDYNKIVEEIAPECRGRLTRPVRRTMSLAFLFCLRREPMGNAVHSLRSYFNVRKK